MYKRCAKFFFVVLLWLLRQLFSMRGVALAIAAFVIYVYFLVKRFVMFVASLFPVIPRVDLSGYLWRDKVEVVDPWLRVRDQVVDSMPTFRNYVNFWPDKFSVVELVGLVCTLYAACVLFRAVFRTIMSLVTWTVGIFDFTKVSPYMEKMRQGSILMKSERTPAFQVEIWASNSLGVYGKVGQGFNTEFGIFTAWHVINNYDEVRIVGPLRAINVRVDQFENLESDVALLRSVPLVLGLAQAKLMDIGGIRRSGCYVTIQAFGQVTMGLLKAMDEFGMCVYEGSTIRGFSGAPYFAGKTVYGMHVAGTTSHNIGFEAAYLHMLARRDQESTEDYLMREIMGGKDYNWTRSPYQPDEARLKVDGRYYLVDIDFARKLKPENRFQEKNEYSDPQYQENLAPMDQVEVDARKLPLCNRSVEYDDSKNLLVNPAVTAGFQVREELNGVRRSISKGQLEVDLESQELSDRSSTGGQQRMPARRKPASQNIAISELKRQLESLSQRVEKEVSRLQPHSRHTEDGKRSRARSRSKNGSRKNSQKRSQK